MASKSVTRRGEGYIIAAVSELPPGARKIVTVNGREIGVFNVAGVYYALRNRCPHRAAPLCLGRLRPQVVSSGVGQVGHERENEILKCPWHLWEFDLKTGHSLHDKTVRVRTYQVVAEDDKVVLYLR